MNVEISFTQELIAIPPIDLPSLEIGACVEFHGIVRETEEGTALASLQYEAYERMAESELRRAISELAVAFPCEAVLFIHRLGWVSVGEPSMYLRVLSSHRKEAFMFALTLLDRLKLDVPIWKVAYRES
jgi:molybdopterin synthase catalytic subunit